MPTTTFTITPNNYDGVIDGGADYLFDTNQMTVSRPQSTEGTGGLNIRAFMIFSGVTLPAGATLNSAYLDVYMTSPFTNFQRFHVYGNKQSSGKPIRANLEWGASLVSDGKYFAVSTASTISNPPNTYWFNVGSNFNSRDEYGLCHCNVTSIVQSLYDSYGPYSNDNMCFYIGKPYSVYSAPYTLKVYGKNWETGPGPYKSPKLVINYTAASTPLSLQDKTTYIFD
jgi:hypothetical protein